MSLHSRVIAKILLSVVLALVVVGCSTDNSSDSNTVASPELGSAQIVLPVDDRRIAIVHSQTSKSNFYDPFAYNQLFAAMQHQAMMAGLPFDLLNEDQLASADVDLLAYDTILIPQFTHVKSIDREAIVLRLLDAQQNGVGIITSGEFLGSREDGTSYVDFTSAMISVLGVQPVQYFNGVAASVTATDTSHPITKTYDPNEELVSYEQIWFASFEPVSGEQSTAITTIETDGATYAGAQSIERSGRVVHFANDQIMADNNLLWRVLQWVTYGDIAPVSMQVSRSDHVFLARNDMDQAMIASDLIRTEIPLLNIIRDWKEQYNFVGSYYIDIGNDPAVGQYTDWSISGPLYRNYIELGNEIATHSWTHPHHTSLLTAEELEFEFRDSAAEIGTNVGTPVIGAAVPGNAESLEVVETLNPWLEYLSGRTGAVGSGYLGATGFLEPQHSMMYFSLNMSPDFTLIDFLGKTPAESTKIWRDELDGLLKHSQQPLVHWLWHDYGPTTQTDAGLYTQEMFSETIAHARDNGAEFATVQDIHKRIKQFAEADLQVGSAGTVTANINAREVGQFSLKVTEGAKIDSVANWYAYSDDRVFLPDDGGEFVISLTTPNDVASPVTRITDLPMRSRLISLTGDGDRLNFTFHGEGNVKIRLSDAMANNTSVSGADSFIENGNELELKFNQNATHVVELMPVIAINQPPVATDTFVSAEAGSVVSIPLSANDADNDTLSYALVTEPQFGTLSGTAPDLQYLPDAHYSGSDSFMYTVSDGTATSASATVEITVTRAASLNNAPVANELILETLIDRPQVFQLSGFDKENQPLSFRVVNFPANGSLTGTAPDLIYTPNTGFTGTDTISFVVNDSLVDSEPGIVEFNVDLRLPSTIGTVSNATDSITLDGDLNEWSEMTAFGTDPLDISGTNNQIDWQSAYMSHDASSFYIGYTEHGNSDLTWGNQIYLDTDSDSTTGFKGFASDSSIGADFLIEGGALFRYIDDLGIQNDWLWTFVTDLDAHASDEGAEIEIPRARLNNPDSMLLYFFGNSAATAGTSIDYFPDNANNAQSAFRTRHFSYSVNSNTDTANHAPIAFAQLIQITEGTSYPLFLSGFDPDGDPLEYIIGLDPSDGTLSGTAPNLIYTPNTNVAYDLMAYSVSDGSAESELRSIEFFIQPAPSVNTQPSANSQTVQALAGNGIEINLTGTDADEDTLTYRIVQQPTVGALSGTPPDLTYMAPNQAGTDSFTFVVNDGSIDSAETTVVINVSESSQTNSIPQAESQSLSINFETALGITLVATDPDNDPLSYVLASQPRLGILSGTAPQLTYIPFAEASGSDSFTFLVNDGTTNSAIGTVSIEILPQTPDNQSPTANGQALATAIAQPLNIVLSGRDPEQQALGYNIVSQPQSGDLSGTAPNLTYLPNNGFSGVDSFTFNVSDGDLSSTNAVVSINVGSAVMGVVSNRVSSLTIDGSISDWNGLQSLGTDPVDIGGVSANNPLDWREVWVAHSTTDLYIAYKNHEAFTLSWGHGIYIDTDNNINTGFRGFDAEFPIGADILIEFSDVQLYTGSGTDWAWITSGEADVQTAGEIGELAVPLAALATQNTPTSLRFYLRADNAAFAGTTVDHFPDAAIDLSADSSLRSLTYSLAP